MPGLQGQALNADLACRHRRRDQHCRPMRHERQAFARIFTEPYAHAHAADDRRGDPQGTGRAARLPRERRIELPYPVARGDDAVRRRKPAHPPCHADRQRTLYTLLNKGYL